MLIQLNQTYPSIGQSSISSQIASNVTADIDLQTEIFSGCFSNLGIYRTQLKIKFSVNTSYKLTILADATRQSYDEARLIVCIVYSSQNPEIFYE